MKDSDDETDPATLTEDDKGMSGDTIVADLDTDMWKYGYANSVWF